MRKSNGIQDEGENGVQDVKVTLYSANGAELKTTQTNASGEYHFTNVPKGNYTIGFSDLPAGYVFTENNQGTNIELDSNVNMNGRTAIIVVNGVANIGSIDAGIKTLSSVNSRPDVGRGTSGQSTVVDVLANDGDGTYELDPSTVKITTTPDGATLSEDGRT